MAEAKRVHEVGEEYASMGARLRQDQPRTAGTRPAVPGDEGPTR